MSDFLINCNAVNIIVFLPSYHKCVVASGSGTTIFMCLVIVAHKIVLM